MDVLSMEVRNFLTVEHASVKLQGRGLQLIQGENRDDSSAGSNGAGKSSIPDALLWCLFGVTARGESGDAVVNERAGKDCLVTTWLRDGKVEYRVTRYRKDSKYKNKLFLIRLNPHTDLSRGTDRETQEEIDKIIGCSYDVFMAAIYAGQEAMPDLPGMTDKQLKVLIEEAAGVQRLEAGYRVAQKRALEASRALEAALIKERALVEQKDWAFADHRTALQRHDEFERGREDRAKAIEEEAKLLKGQLVDLLKGRLLPEEQETLRTRLGALQAAIDSHAGAVRAATEWERSAVSPAVREVGAATGRLEAAKEAARKLKRRHDNAEQELKEPCRECGKPHTPEELEQLRSTLFARLREELQRVKEAQQALSDAEQKHSQATYKNSELKALIPDVSAAVAEMRDINAKLSADEKRRAEARTLLEKAKAAAARAEAERTGPNPHVTAVQMLDERISELGKELHELGESIALLRTKDQVAQSVCKVLGPAGVRAHILDTVTPFLNERTAEYLATLSDGNITATWTTLTKTAKGELRERFGIEVSHSKGAKSFKGLSGGEKRKVRLATMLALQDLVASRATKPINLWIGDEIDDALDSAGLERLIVILERKAREKGTVLIISHNDLNAWIDNVTTVVKEGGLATIEGALAT